jgi:hypothetical protein
VVDIRSPQQRDNAVSVSPQRRDNVVDSRSPERRDNAVSVRHNEEIMWFMCVKENNNLSLYKSNIKMIFK